jgi:hypothetical protein
MRQRHSPGGSLGGVPSTMKSEQKLILCQVRGGNRSSNERLCEVFLPPQSAPFSRPPRAPVNHSPCLNASARGAEDARPLCRSLAQCAGGRHALPGERISTGRTRS